MFAPAWQTTARAGLRSKLAALVVRRQALTPPRGVEDAAPYSGGRHAFQITPPRAANLIYYLLFFIYYLKTEI